MHSSDGAQPGSRSMLARRREVVALVLSIGAGLAIAGLDSRPGWDDTGITAGLLVVAAFASAAISGRRPWLWALLVGGWIPLIEIAGSGQASALLALLFAAGGALAGYSLARVIPNPSRG
jgi:hypothetical protein